jgi:hypothetical protein
MEIIIISSNVTCSWHDMAEILLICVSNDSIVKGIIDDIINTAVKTAEVDEQKTK